jgi:hypothetical protein
MIGPSRGGDTTSKPVVASQSLKAKIAISARRGVGRPPCRARRSEQIKRLEFAEQARRLSWQIDMFSRNGLNSARIFESIRWKMSSRVEASTYLALNHIFRKLLSHRATTRIYFISRSRMMRLLCADCMRPSNKANVSRVWMKTSAFIATTSIRCRSNRVSISFAAPDSSNHSAAFRMVCRRMFCSAYSGISAPSGRCKTASIARTREACNAIGISTRENIVTQGRENVRMQSTAWRHCGRTNPICCGTVLQSFGACRMSMFDFGRTKPILSERA